MQYIITYLVLFAGLAVAQSSKDGYTKATNSPGTVATSQLFDSSTIVTTGTEGQYISVDGVGNIAKYVNGKWTVPMKAELESARAENALLKAQIAVLRQELQINELPEVKAARCTLAAELSAEAARKKAAEAEAKPEAKK